MNLPSVADFKSFFYRDFPYGTDMTTVQDQDITRAMADAYFSFNDALFSTQANFTTAYLYLTAHYLVMNLRASTQGLNGSYSWLTSSKGVGSVSEGFSIPQHVMDNPALAMLSKTNYGARYIAFMIPQLIGQVFCSEGRTHA